MTREEYIATYGMTPEEVAAKAGLPAPQEQSSAQKLRMRRYMKREFTVKAPTGEEITIVAPTPVSKPQQYNNQYDLPSMDEPSADIQRERSLDAFLMQDPTIADPETQHEYIPQEFMPEAKPATGKNVTLPTPRNAQEEEYLRSPFLGNPRSAAEDFTHQAEEIMLGETAKKSPDAAAALANMRNAEARSARMETNATIRSTQNMASGVMQIPTEVPGILDLIRVGGETLGKQTYAMITGNVRGTLLDELSYNFGSALLGDEGLQELSDYATNAVTKYKETKPDATDEEINAYLETVQDSDEYYEFLMSRMSPGLALSEYGNRVANELVGLDVRPDKQTWVDDVTQVVAQSAVTLPAAVRKYIAAKVIDRVATNTFGKAAVRVGEVLTPLTLPYTAKNVALNAGVGVAITDVMRNVSDMPSVTGGDLLTEELNIGAEPDEVVEAIDFSPQLMTLRARFEALDGAGARPEQNNAAPLAAGLFAIFAGYGGIKAFKTKALQAVEFDHTAGGRTLEEQSKDIKPVTTPLDKANAVFNQNAIINNNIRRIEGKGDSETVHIADAIQSKASNVNIIEAEHSAFEFGILPNDVRTIPVSELDRAYKQLSTEEQKLFDNFIYAEQRLQDYRIGMQGLQKEFTDLTNQLGKLSMTPATAAPIHARRGTVWKQMQDLRTDLPETRTSFEAFTRVQAQDAVNAASANQNVMRVAKMLQNISHSMLHSAVKGGDITAQEAQDLLNKRPFYVPLRELDTAGKSFAQRAGTIFKNRLFGKETSPYVMDRIKKARNIDPNQPKVNITDTPVEAMKYAVKDLVRDLNRNQARRDLIDLMRKVDNNSETLVRPYKFNLNNRQVTAVTPAQLTAIQRSTGLEFPRDKFVRVQRNGMVEYWEADPAIVKSLQFSPTATVPVFNEFRRLKQTTLTGIGAPAFAAKSLMWDVPLAAITRPKGYSFGLVDTYLRRLFMNSSMINGIADTFVDPTVLVQVGMAIPAQLYRRARRAVAKNIAEGVRNQSTIMNAIGALPGGNQMLFKMGEATLAAMDRTAHVIFTKSLPTSMSHVADQASTATSFKTLLPKVNNKVSNTAAFVTAPARSMFNGYVAMLESIQNASRYAFFMQNYGTLAKKYGGSTNIPNKDLELLIRATRNLTGDMTRQSSSKFVQGAASVTPYGNTILQGTRHVLASFTRPDKQGALNWFRFMTGIGLPAIGMHYLLDQWKDAREYWDRKTPDFVRMTSLPSLSPQVLKSYFETGKFPTTFNADTDIIPVPIAPELSLLVSGALAMARGAGFLGPINHADPNSGALSDIRAGIGQLFSFATNPLILGAGLMGGQKLDMAAMLRGEPITRDVMEQPFSGVNSDKMSMHSGIEQMTYEWVTAFFGVTGDTLMRALNVGEIAQDINHYSFDEAVEKALGRAWYENERRLPAPIQAVWGGAQRRYAYTPESKHVYDINNKYLEKIFAQRSIQKDSKDRNPSLMAQGLAPAATIRDPMLAQITEELYSKIRKKGAYKAAQEEYTELRVQLSAVEGQANIPTTEGYHKRKNNIVAKQQLLKESQSNLLNLYEQQMRNKYGDVFQAKYGTQFSYETLLNAIEGDVQVK